MAEHTDGSSSRFSSWLTKLQIELTEPWKAVEELVLRTNLHEDQARASRRSNQPPTRVTPLHREEAVGEASAGRLRRAVLPGGEAPDSPHTDPNAVRLHAHNSSTKGKPVAAICHTAWTPLMKPNMSTRSSA